MTTRTMAPPLAHTREELGAVRKAQTVRAPEGRGAHAAQPHGRPVARTRGALRAGHLPLVGNAGELARAVALTEDPWCLLLTAPREANASLLTRRTSLT